MADPVSVLLVEDEAPQRDLIAGILGRDGCVVTATGTVSEALSALEGEVPDLVLCDWRMPGADGGELLAEHDTFGRAGDTEVSEQQGDRQSEYACPCVPWGNR